MKKFFKQLFCKHNYIWFFTIDAGIMSQKGNVTVSNEMKIYICPKCKSMKYEDLV